MNECKNRYKVYCDNCDFLDDECVGVEGFMPITDNICTAPENTKCESSWLKKSYSYKLPPRKINKYNNCIWHSRFRKNIVPQFI